MTTTPHPSDPLAHAPSTEGEGAPRGTLTDFLLARIAEDEASAREAEGHDEFGEARTYYGHHGPHRDDWGVYTFHVDPSRVLAECEAKRRIVESSRWVINQERVPTGRPGVYDRVNVYAVNEDREEVLQLLALPYADHPDYREEWRP